MREQTDELFGFNAGEDAELFTILNKPTLPLHTALFWGICTHQLFPIKCTFFLSFFFFCCCKEVPLGICNACQEALKRLFYSASTPTRMLLQAVTLVRSNYIAPRDFLSLMEIS